MDGRTFDKLTRHLAAAQSRRQTIKAVVGGALGVGLSAVGLRAAAQDDGLTIESHRRCRLVGEQCRRGGQCCDPKDTACARLSSECRNNDLTGDRCCKTAHQKCVDSCECCRSLSCNPNTNTCRRT